MQHIQDLQNIPPPQHKQTNIRIPRVDSKLSNQYTESNLSDHHIDSGISILHQTKNKFRKLGSSILLTSSLMSHKIKKQQHRKDNSCKGLECIDTGESVMTTKKVNILSSNTLSNRNNGKVQMVLRNCSNIDSLKKHANNLMKDEVLKLGKENNEQDYQNQVKQSQDLNRCASLMRKPNQRRIIKGRADMHIIFKKRQLLNRLLAHQQHKIDQEHNKFQFCQKAHQLLNSNEYVLKAIDNNSCNNAFKAISSNSQNLQQRSLYQNIVKHSIEIDHTRAKKCMQKQYGKIRKNSAFKASCQSHQRSVSQHRMINMNKGNCFRVFQRRYSSVNTIE